MRINIYSQELTDEVITGAKVSNTGREYGFVQLILHSSPMLHHPPQDDDRSAVTFWFPTSNERRHSIAQAFRKIADAFDASHMAQAQRDLAEARYLNKIVEDDWRDRAERGLPANGRAEQAWRADQEPGK